MSESNSLVTVTSENRAEFMAEKLGLSNEPEVLATENVELEPEAKETEPTPEDDTSDVKSKPNKLEKRFSEITQKARDAEEKANREAEARVKAEKELQELRSKLQPPVEDEELKEPNREDYTDAFEYAKDLADYAAKNAIKQRDLEEQQKRANAEREVVITNWQKQLEAARAELPDFDDMLASTDAVVPDHIRDAIIESDVGAKVLYHLADNPDIAAKLTEMSPAKAYVELGKLIATFGTKPQVEQVAKVSKAPQPITPVKGASATDSYFDSKGEFTGTPAQYRELRKAGKIR